MWKVQVQMYKFIHIFILFLFSIMFSGGVLCAQKLEGQALVDSLLDEVPRQKDDSNKVYLLLRLSAAYSERDPDESAQYKYRSLALARKLGMNRVIGDIYISFGRFYFNSFDSSYFYVRKAIDFSRSVGDSQLLGRAYGDMGVLLESGGNTSGRETEHTVSPDAALYLDSSASIYRAIGYNAGHIDALTRKAEVLIYLNRLDEAKDVLAHAQSVIDSSPDKSDGNFIGLYAMKGLYFEKTKLYDSVIIYYKKALRITDTLKSVAGTAYMLSRIAIAYSKQGRFAQAEECAKEGLKLCESKRYLKERMDVVTSLYEIYKDKGDYKKALEYYETLFRVTDSLNASKLQHSISRFNLQLESERNKKKIALLLKDKEISDNVATRQRVIFVALAGGILMLIILAFVIYNRYQIKQKALALSQEQNEIITREKEKSDELLLNILPEEVAHDLKERGATTAQQFDHVTVMFTDFVDFTKAGELMGSQALVEELHNCFKGFDEILDKHGIEKIKTIGDAYLAVCGLPTADDRHAEKIVTAAREILDFMRKRREQLGEKTFELRIGIHSGSVVAGIVGVKKFAYDIWGDTVNTAARMEQNSEPGKINISQTTHDYVKDKFTCSYRGELEAKNKGKLKMYFVDSVVVT